LFWFGLINLDCVYLLIADVSKTGIVPKKAIEGL